MGSKHQINKGILNINSIIKLYNYLIALYNIILNYII